VVAWLIAGTTALCGSGEACVKASVPLLHGLTACFIYGAAARLYDRRAGFFAGLLYLTLPGVSFSSAIISTDPPLLTFWSAGFYALVRLIDVQGRGLAWWSMLGVTMGLGLLSKYAMGFFILALVLWLTFDGDGRQRLLAGRQGKLGLALAGIVAVLLYLPNLWWNVTAGFVTFAHTAANADLGGRIIRPDKLVDFITGQFGVFGPITFAVLLWLLFRPDRWLREPRARMLATFILTILAPIVVLSFITRANGNWAAPAYVAGSIWVAGALTGRMGRIAVAGSIVLHTVAAGIVMGGLIGQAAPGRYWGVAVSPKLDFYRKYRGWGAMGVEVGRIRAQFPDLPLIGRRRMMVASMLYYGGPRPVPIYAWRSRARIKNHYHMTRPWRGTLGSDALVIIRNRKSNRVLGRFRAHNLVATISVPISTGRKRRVQVFHARGFLGYKRAQQ
jgi:4-amino-4-deoxy-L-arabinose transferase-like glycosyltransferase